MDQLTIERQAPVIAQYDAVVCGGGPAGWVAAVSAARNGCRTALIEYQCAANLFVVVYDVIYGGYKICYVNRPNVVLNRFREFLKNIILNTLKELIAI